jgi:hypothetical protein
MHVHILHGHIYVSTVFNGVLGLWPQVEEWIQWIHIWYVRYEAPRPRGTHSPRERGGDDHKITPAAYALLWSGNPPFAPLVTQECPWTQLVPPPQKIDPRGWPLSARFAPGCGFSLLIKSFLTFKGFNADSSFTVLYMWKAVVKNLCCVHVISYAHLGTKNAELYDEFKTATENVFLVFSGNIFINETKVKLCVIYTYFVKNNQFSHTFSLVFFFF